MPICWDFLYEQKSKKTINPLQQAYVDVEELPFIPVKENNLSENIVIIDLITDKI